jgi:hypothetical protein
MERDQGQWPGLRLGEDKGMTVCEHCGEPYEGRDCQCIFEGVDVR